MPWPGFTPGSPTMVVFLLNYHGFKTLVTKLIVIFNEIVSEHVSTLWFIHNTRVSHFSKQNAPSVSFSKKCFLFRCLLTENKNFPLNLYVYTVHSINE